MYVKGEFSAKRKDCKESRYGGRSYIKKGAAWHVRRPS